MYIVLSGFLELDVASGGEGHHEHHGSALPEHHEKYLENERNKDEAVFRRLLEMKVLTRFSRPLKSWAQRARSRVAQGVHMESEVDDSPKQNSTSLSTDPSRGSHLWSGVRVNVHNKARDSYGTAICVFKSGDAFGEMALLKEAGIRSGTVICKFFSYRLFRYLNLASFSFAV